jgi:hypothetical protein
MSKKVVKDRGDAKECFILKGFLELYVIMKVGLIKSNFVKTKIFDQSAVYLDEF